MAEELKLTAKELYKPARRKYPTRSVPAMPVDEIWSADLADMSYTKAENDGYIYILSVIDVGSRYGWAVPVLNKKASTIASEIAKITTKDKREPKKVWADEGKEFSSLPYTVYHTHGNSKAAIVERFNKTIKTWLLQRMGGLNTLRWTHLLPNIVSEYNERKHRGLAKLFHRALSPNEVVKYRPQVSSPEEKLGKAKFKQGDVVRISRLKQTFEKGYTPNWSRAIYTIDSVDQREPPTYHLRERDKTLLEGSFYEAELQLVDPKIREYFTIEKTIKTDKKKKRIFVKWLGYDDKYNSWVNEKDAMDVPK